MLGEERQNAILRMVEEKSSITVHELMEQLDASESTIRRDLNSLDEEGKLIKVHGGALAKDNEYRTKDADVESRINLNRDEKTEIAKYAAALIEAGDVVYLDAGTTTELMVNFLKTKDVTFVTNAFAHAKKLSQAGFTTYVLGGEFKALTEAIVGEEAIMALDKYNFTKGFFGVNGVNVKNGCTTPDAKEAMVKKKALSKTKEKYVLCDSSKFDEISTVTFAKFEDVSIITTELDNNIVGEDILNAKNVMEVKKG